MNKLPIPILARCLIVALALAALALQAPLNAVELPGLRPDGSVLLPNRWSLRPAGRQVALGDFPVNIAVHPKGRFAAILHCGYGPHQIMVVDLSQAAVVSRTGIREAFYGLEFSSDGHRLYCSGAGDEAVHVFDFDSQKGSLARRGAIHIHDSATRGIPCGLALGPEDRQLFAANLWGQTVSQVDLTGSQAPAEFFFSGKGAPPSKTFTNQEPIEPGDAAAEKRAQAAQGPLAADAPFPYDCKLDPRRRLLYVSLWGLSEVAVVDLESGRVGGRWPTGQHPNEMVLTKTGDYLFVANGNGNTVTIIDTAKGRALESLDSALWPASLPGSTPNSLALSPDETKLFVANARNNNVAVFDVTRPGRSRSLGFIPVGWYPTSVRVTPDGRQLLVANGRGLTSRANPKGPQPNKKDLATTQYIAGLFPGTLSIINLPSGGDWRKQLAAYTAQVFQCAPQPAARPPLPPAQTQWLAGPAKSAAIRYCIYIIKENRTYDQILGDLPQGNGDASLCLFPEKITPNHHRLARDFVLFDNFYVDAIVSADGHEWSMGAYASDFVEKTWPLEYGHNRTQKYIYPAEGLFPIATPAGGYLWDRANQAGVSYRSYGEFVFAGDKPGEPNWTRQPALRGHFDPVYRVFDLTYPDLKRAERFLQELKRWESQGEMPQLQIVRLPNDHTEGTSVNALTPTAYLADNDWALGKVVEGVSRSKFWPQTAIFVLEDDAQNGPDHVDAHRSPAFIISPYTRGAGVDSTMYSTSSLLRTIELLLGLRPMSQFDAAATPMFRSFRPNPDPRPYVALQPEANLNERNSLLSWGSAASSKMDFSREDAADETALNEIIWHSVRGAASPMPPPVHAAFVFDSPKGKDND